MKKSTIKGHRKVFGVADNPEWILFLMLFYSGVMLIVFVPNFSLSTVTLLVKIKENNPLLLSVVFTLGTLVLPTRTSARGRYHPL